MDALLRLVNEEISQENSASLFVAAIVGIINVRTGEMQFCNAGHDAPILLRANEPPRSLNGAGGPPLCVDEDFPYAIDRLQLQTDDMLVMVTDGITEAQDARSKLLWHGASSGVLFNHGSRGSLAVQWLFARDSMQT